MHTASYLPAQTEKIAELLHRWLVRQLSTSAVEWLDQKREQISCNIRERVFFTSFSAVTRIVGKQDLELTAEDLEAATAIRFGWFPDHWSVDQAARSLLLLALPQDNSERYLQTLERLFNAADVGELVALYQALPLLAYPERLQKRAQEGIRSNMTAVFNAVALLNPYPVEYFDDLAWNQMVLKAAFVGSPLHLIQGLNERVNPELKQMLLDYASERQAAKRPVPSELWNLIGSLL